jgi:regulator of protease activity HflC (stomatin/prohibitin superfamily)
MNDVVLAMAFFAASVENPSMDTIATTFGIIWLVVQILDRIFPRSDTRALTEEMRKQTQILATFVEVNKERHDSVMAAIRESRKTT